MDYQKQLLLKTTQFNNILPVTSLCNTQCIFCSHKQNPNNINVYSLGHLPMDLIDILIPFLDKNMKIIIGESATRLVEGEPFCHPKFKEILFKVRNEYPQTTISITTNGNLLNKSWFKFLQEIQPVEINYSINSLNTALRKQIMGNVGKYDVAYIIESLAEASITYHGSVVAMNWLVGWDDLEELIKLLDKKNAATIRVFLPGYTKLTNSYLKFPRGFEKELKDRVNEYSHGVSVPVTLEPPMIKTLVPIVNGVLKNSPAFNCGIKKGDIIKAVDGNSFLTRVDTFNIIKRKENPNITLLRKGMEIDISLIKKAGETSGLVMDYDIDGSIINSVRKTVNKDGKAWVFASEFGYFLVDELFKKYEEIEVVPTPNHFFGGSIKSAGLLLIEDFLKVFGDIKNKINKKDTIVLPSIAFDQNGYDLSGVSYKDFENTIGIKTFLV